MESNFIIGKHKIQSNVKVGDEYWFVTIHNCRIWKDTVVKITDNYVYFEKGNYHYKNGRAKKDGRFTIGLNDFSIDTTVRLTMNGMWQNIDTVWFSKNKNFVQRYALQLIQESKEEKLINLQKLANAHYEELTNVEALEKYEKQILKLLGKNVS